MSHIRQPQLPLVLSATAAMDIRAWPQCPLFAQSWRSGRAALYRSRMRIRAAGLLLFLASCHHPRAQESGGVKPADSPVPSVMGDESRSAFTPEQLSGAVGYADIEIAPDGSEVAFTTDKSGSYEVWTAPIVEGVIGARTQRTHQKENATGLRYSPDGQTLVFGNDHGGDERNDLFLLARGAAEPVQLTTTESGENEGTLSPDGKTLAYLSDRERDFRFNLEVMDLGTKKSRVLTHETINCYGLHWSLDGKSIALVRTPDDQKGDLLVADVASAKVKVIQPPRKDGMLAPQGFLADGRIVALTTNDAGFEQVALVDVASGRSELVGPSDWDVESARVLDDGTVIFSRNVHGESELMTTPGPKPFVIPARVVAKGGVFEDFSVDRAGRFAIALRQTSSRPTEIVTIDPRGAGSVKLAVAAELPGVDVSKLAQAERR